MKSSLAGLYYPFSRSVQPDSLKQMLLVFDEITFVDPVVDAEWRAQLFTNLEPYDAGFAQYQHVDAALPELIQQGCIKRFDPGPRINDRELATLSALGDLDDQNWTLAASSPRKHGMPSISIEGKPSWQVFKPKLPNGFADALQTRPELRRHMLQQGSDRTSWSLSYAAGSAIAISVHLDIADELGLAPITDSSMHHRLMLMKAARAFESNNAAAPVPDDVVRVLTVEMASTLLSQVLREEQLHNATFEEIIRFRAGTAALRRHFIADIVSRTSQLRSIASAQEWIVGGRQILAGLETEFRKYEAEFASGKMKVWPGIVRSAGTAGVGSLTAVALSLIPGPHTLLLGGVAALAVGAAAAHLDWAAERVRLEKSAAPPVAYLSRVSKELGN
jgi:hypothetical protein